MIVLISFSIINYLLFYYFYKALRLKWTDSRSSGYIISTVHAIGTSIGYLYLLWSFYHSCSFQTLKENYNILHSFSIGYAAVDLMNLIEDFVYRDDAKTTSYFATIASHHIFILIGNSASYYITNHINSSLSWYMSLAYLAEISTPILNYIQYYRGNVSIKLKLAFMVLYFICRPVSYTYLSLAITYKFGTFSPITIMIVQLTMLNYYWFYRIYLKSQDNDTIENDTNDILVQNDANDILVDVIENDILVDVIENDTIENDILVDVIDVENDEQIWDWKHRSWVN